jgi:uncharacterized membrane protein YgdD (TMEM256/DUF423 family)
MAGYYSGRNHSLAKLGLNLSFLGAVLGIFASAAYKKQKATQPVRVKKTRVQYALVPGR